ncbi:MAG: hypothetical protein LIP16_00295 [Clostridium sp.]|nr:hypothetical protein [Clostridium sp.]
MIKSKSKRQLAALLLIIAAAAMPAGCGKAERNEQESGGAAARITESSDQDRNSGAGEPDAEKGGSLSGDTAALEVRFGDGGAPFVMELEDNETAAAIAGYVGTADWRLPIYHYDDYEDWEVMQYYDIPSRYEIPGRGETVTSEKAGEVYYSEPNRIILFYQDGEVNGEYIKIGTIEDTEEFREAVESNPVLEGWGNKIILINSIDNSVEERRGV